MKKLLLCGALALAALPVMAQDNLILNGDFTETQQDGDQLLPTEWTKYGNVWSNRVNVLEFDDAVDPDLDPDDLIGNLTNYVCSSLYDWNSWERGGIKQIIEREMEETYTFSYIWRAYVESVRAAAGGVNPVTLLISIEGCDSEGTVSEGDEPLQITEINWEDGEDWISTDWAKVSQEVNLADYDFAIVKVQAFGQSGDDSQGGSGQNKVGMCAADMKLLKGGAAVEAVEAGNVVATKYYGIDGMEILNPAKGQLVIEKAMLENGTAKVAKRVIR